MKFLLTFVYYFCYKKNEKIKIRFHKIIIRIHVLLFTFLFYLYYLKLFESFTENSQLSVVLAIFLFY